LQVSAVDGIEEVFQQVCLVLDQFEEEKKMLEELQGKNIVFVLGGPGSGKGTQCDKIVSKYGFCHLSTGDLLREELASGSTRAQELKEIMAEGELVSMDTVLELVKEAMIKNKDCNGFLIDGFPRDVPQGEKFEKEIGACKFILYFECSNDEMTKRLLERAKTSGRVDDNKETIRKRLRTFADQTIPVVDKFAERVRKINAMRAVDDIFGDVCTALDTLK